MAEDPTEITILLRRWTAGDRDAGEQLFVKLQNDLKRIAAACLRRERKNHTLRRTEMVGMLYIALAQGKKIDWADRNHFFAICTIKLRRILIDHAKKYHKVELVALDGLPEDLFGRRTKLEVMVAVDRLLDELEKESVRKCCVVVLKSYVGFSDKETSELLGVTVDVVEHEFHRARKWLYQRLTEPPCQAMGTAPNK